MPEHGELDPQSQNRWFCGYWMTQEEWEDIHDYAPPAATGVAEQQREEEKEEQEEEEEG
ncbi:hypothetical protein [Nitrososphaera viennensis]|uniref:Uncharacterized protein n=2 Tax=Nitrososphaera viennensis TaxID=1034015 RepID=A0A060HL91_9ARCH|nr:hypothetical protein [Nitrososphaera viennensis]AIC15970.1 hypothetical protein NVIE_017120 [Nitrososphaera viennensis EN76]UVS67946.1 hypothetical protein NWT39_08520 [Nitrososphaera viennensis]